jgi:hypothetical protein
MTLDLVGFAGAMGAGKDEAAKPLLEDGWVLVKMADPIRQSLRALDLEVTYRGCHVRLNSVIDDIGFDAAKRAIPYIRHVMQRIGDEAGRQIHGEYVWTNIANTRIAELLYSGKRVVVTDLRYDNEAHMVHHLGGKVVLIKRPGTATSYHASEAGLPMSLVDRVILNETSVEQLHLNVRRMLASCNDKN